MQEREEEAEEDDGEELGEGRRSSFTADLADILLFDPSDLNSGNVCEQRRRAATERTPTTLLDEFDPLHPTFKTMQFDDDFKPPPLDSGHRDNGVEVTMATSFHGNVAPTSFSQFSNTNPFLSSTQASGGSGSVDDFDSFAAKRIGQR